MRLFFWLVTAAAFLAAAVGWGWVDPPSMQDVAGSVISDWYRVQMIWAAVIGLGAGVFGAWLAKHRVRLRPRQPSDAFFSRVASFGLWTAAAAVLLVATISALSAYTYASVPQSPMDRVFFLLIAGRYVAVVGLGSLACTLAYWGTTRLMDWSGRYALARF